MNNLGIVKVNSLESEAALELIRELDSELHQRYPGESVHALDLTKVNENNKFSEHVDDPRSICMEKRLV